MSQWPLHEIGKVCCSHRDNFEVEFEILWSLPRAMRGQVVQSSFFTEFR
ncbi:MAG: hypothetical protein JWM11_2242 [Planctomycetaceae bacterium]|nr:hypothetical protein [Planctomycetaceae bacterium]